MRSDGIPIEFEKNSLISLDISEGFNEPIDLISIKQLGALVPEKNIGNESFNLTITYFSGLFNNFEINSELLIKNSFLLSIFSDVEMFNNGML